MKYEIEKLEDYLSSLDDYFSKEKANFDTIMVRSKINELVFWLTMYINDKEDSKND